MALPSLGSDPFLGPSNYPFKIKQLQYTAKNKFQSRIAQILLKNQQITCASPAVFCRIGSLETYAAENQTDMLVFCRIGSLENNWALTEWNAQCFLPHRQLRNYETLVGYRCEGFLPHRQLRKSTRCRLLPRFCFLPHRQLRNA